MQDKQKVTLYLTPSLHRQLKIRAVIDDESMSSLVEKAIAFYLQHPEKVEEVESSHGRTQQVYLCPDCDGAMMMRQGQMVSLRAQPSVVEEEFPLEVPEKISSQADSQGEERLVAC
ncbi:MAG: hypothetical protein HC890_06630 [Chloroflexaceae bacterium]|nr:hypothetical protein [Chloroflexaceae bacterium]